MGIVNRLREGLFKIRVVPKPSIESTTSITDTANSIPEKIDQALNTGKRIDLTDLLNITSLKCSRNQKYKIFEEMVADGRVGSAVEMYANDTVQYNADGKLIWIESEDSTVAYYANKLIEDLNIADNLWSYAYCLCLYGDIYLELFQSNSTSNSKPGLLLEPIKQNQSVRKQVRVPGTRLERYIEKVANPAEIYDLQLKGKTAGFVKSESDGIEGTPFHNTFVYSSVNDKITILNPTKYVHICLSPNINRFPEKFKLVKEDVDKVDIKGYIDGSNVEDTNNSLTFTVKAGQSILENVYGPYQTLKLKEDSVLLERITRSSITRIIQVELGDLPESQKRMKLQEIKDQIEQQIHMNKDTGSIESRPGAQPTENIIYTTTKNGKGTISSVNIGGDGNIGDLEDVNQSENKLYGSLLIPKALLGADMEGSGLSNGGSLTEMNTTYARRIKRIQVALCSGIKTLINIFAICDGLGASVVNNFTVKLTPITTVEDNRRDELLQNKIRNVNDILSLMNNIDIIDETTTLDMIIKWLSSYLNQQDIVDILNDRIKEYEKEQFQNTKQAAAKEKHLNHEISSDDNDSAFPDLDVVDDSETIDTDITDTDVKSNDTADLKTDNTVNLSNIEGQDLL